ncbi:MAG: hypothetical protein SF123_09455 [Chloroflexota bacterium]|nr:hypothetical protein [Chloroflexota bacterium]
MFETAYRLEALDAFDRVFRISKLTALSHLFGQHHHRLHSFRLLAPHMTGQVDRGMQTVFIKCITGSVERAEDFDANFRPRSAHVRERWASIASALQRGEYLPPIELYKVGDEYYVVDGHHRVSVMRYHGQLYIEAHVTEVNMGC